MNSAPKEIFAQMCVISTEVPYDSEEARRKAEEMNKEIAHLGVRTYRAAYDWGFIKYDDLAVNNKGKKDKDHFIPEGLVPFIKGDLVKVFKTVTDGDVLWSGKIKLDRTDYHHGLQSGLEKSKWAAMFFDSLPAKLTKKDGSVVFGSLDPFCETGTEGVIWSLQEYGKSGYAGLHCLEDGEHLSVYSEVRDGKVEWQGRLDFGPEKVKKIENWAEVLRETKHMDTKQWLQMSFDKRPIVLTPAPKR
jgi:hypothetical protein